MKSYNILIYFFDSYWNEINGGGTFSLNELYELFVQFEPPIKVQKFHEEIEEILLELKKEDWELSRQTKVLCNEYGKRRLKEMMTKLQEYRKN